MIIISDEAEENQVLYQMILRECTPKLLEWSREYELRKSYAPKTTYKIRKRIDRTVLKILQTNVPNRTPYDLEVLFKRTVKSIRRIHKHLINQKLIMVIHGRN